MADAPSVQIPNLEDRSDRYRGYSALDHLHGLRRMVDGRPEAPFTANDVLFNIEDLVLNEEFASTAPRYTSGGEPMKEEKVDDYVNFR